MPFAQRKPRSTITAPTVPASSSSTTTSAQIELKFPIESERVSPIARRRRSAGTISASERIQPIFNRLKAATKVVYDAETSGKSWRQHFICGHVLAFSNNPNDSFYLPVRHGGGGNLCNEGTPAGDQSWSGKLHPIEADLIKLLDRPGLTLVGHNLNFDLKFLSRLGLQLRGRYIDTMIDAALIDELQGAFSLAFCAGHSNIQAKKDIVPYLIERFPEAAKAPSKAMGQFWRLAGDDPQAVDYASGDGVTTWQLHQHQLPQIAEQELQQVWDIECRLIPVLTRMSIKGIRIDEDQFKILRAEVKREIARLEGAFTTDFNVRSPIDVKWWCEQNNRTDWPMTAPSKKFPDGQPSLNEHWLETFAAGQQIVAVRKLYTLRDSYLTPLQRDHIWQGRVHTNFNQLRGDEYGYITGRLSSSEPNLQQASKHNETIGRMHRSIFVPDDGMVWGSADFAQIEPRLLAYYSKCKVLMTGFAADPPVDAHTAVAIACNPRWAKLTLAEQKYYRNVYAKRINQTLLTGGGKGVLVKKYGMNPQEVDRIWNDYFRAMPEIKFIQKRMERVMRTRGYIRTLLGRRCRMADPNRAYVALNRALQGGNADIMKLKLVEIDDYLASVGRPLDILNSVHDSIDFQFPLEHRKHYDECLRIMQSFGPDDVIQLPIPIIVDVNEGNSWAIATFGEEE